MLVRPTYKPVWEIPGGVVEHNESPKQCCRREVQEEIGLEREIGDLLVVDYNTQTETKTESLMFIFNGGVLNSSEVRAVKLAQAEISEFRFFKITDLPGAMTDSMRNRVIAAWQQVTKSNGAYLEDQEPA